LRWDAESSSYQQVFIGPTTVDSDDTIAWAALGEVTGAGPRELVLFRWNERVNIYDQASHLLIRSFVTGLPDGHPLSMSLLVDDLDRKPGAEIAVSNGEQIRFFDSTGRLLWVQAGAGGAMTVGQMDADVSLEVATGTGHVIDFDSRAVQWHAPARFGGRVESGDFDGDGMDEVIGTYPDLFAYDVDTEQLIWSLPNPSGVGALELVDLDSDGTLELVVGNAQWADLMTLDPVSLEIEWSLDNPGYGTRGLVIDDTDGDGTREVVWTTEGSQGIFVADWTQPAIEWTAADLCCTFLTPALGDLDGDGIEEVVVSTDGSLGGAGRLFVLSSDRLQPLAVSDPILGGGIVWTTAIDLHDLDHDGDDEIVATVSTGYDGTIQVWDYVGGSEPRFEPLWKSGVLQTGGFGSVAADDLDGDGVVEIVVSSAGALSAYDWRTGVRRWRTTNGLVDYLGIWSLETVANGRGRRVLAALAVQQGVLFFDDGGHRVASLEGDYVAFDSRFRGAGRIEVVTVEAGGRVCSHQVRTKGTPAATTLGCRSLDQPWVQAIAFASKRAIWLAAGGRIHLYADEGIEPLYVSENYGVPHTHTDVGQGLVPFRGGVLSNGLFSVRRYEDPLRVRP
jgi:hypothetical protein